MTCRPVFALVREHAAPLRSATVEAITWVPAEQIETAARVLWENRPVSYFAWAGVEQHTNTTQCARALSLLYALTGSFGARGGNLQFDVVPSAPVTGAELLSPEQRARTLGLRDRPLGPARLEYATSDELYRAILDDDPYPVRGLAVFGANLLLSHSDSLRGREALRALDFFVHVDLFMTPTGECADVVLPASTPFEREALKIGFESSADAQSFVQLRQPVVPPQGESRGDTEIVFDLACRLGLGEHFWDGDIEAGYRYQLGPSGITLEELRAHPEGIRVPLETHDRAFAEEVDGRFKGFATPTGLAELYSERFLDHGYPPLPEFEEPLVSQQSRPDLADRFPLVLTCTHNPHFCESQHRGIARLRKLSRDPEVELHPSGGGRPRDRRGRLGGDRNPERVGARSRPVQCIAGCAGGGGPAWMVARVRGDRCAELRSVQLSWRESESDREQRGGRSGERVGAASVVCVRDTGSGVLSPETIFAVSSQQSAGSRQIGGWRREGTEALRYDRVMREASGFFCSVRYAKIYVEFLSIFA